MHGEIGVLRHEHGAQLRQIEIHFGRRFRAGRELEDEAEIADRHLFSRARDEMRRRDERQRAARQAGAEARCDLAFRRARQREPELIARAARHRGAGDDVLRDGLFEKALRRDDLDLAGRRIGRGRHTFDAAIVIGVAVRIDDGKNRLLRHMLIEEFERRARGLGRGQRIDDDPARAGVDKRNRRHVEAAHLIDALGDLEETVLGEDLRLPPEAGIGCLRRGTFEEIVRREIDCGAAVLAHDLRIFARRDEAAACEIEILAVVGFDQCARFRKRAYVMFLTHAQSRSVLRV